MTRKKEIILIGGGGHCKSVIDVIETEGKFQISGIIDIPEKKGSEVFGYPIIGTDDDIEALAKKIGNFFITLGFVNPDNKRFELYSKVKRMNIMLPVIVSPFAYVAKDVKIGEGSIIMHHVLLNRNCEIGANCIINNKALIEHDAIVENHCHIATAAVINGGVKVGQKSFVGSGAVTKQNVIIPHNSFIKANSIVK